MKGCQLVISTLKAATNINVNMAINFTRTIRALNLTLSLTPMMSKIIIRIMINEAGKLINPPWLGPFDNASGISSPIDTNAL